MSQKEGRKIKGLNKVLLLGNVGRDPEIKTTQGGTTVASFSLATPERYKDSSGNWQDKTEWHSMVSFGRSAEIIRDYVHKGSQLFIEGKIQTRSWDDKQTGVKKYKTEIVVNDITLLGGKKDGDSRGRSTRPADEDYVDEGVTDDDIPF